MFLQSQFLQNLFSMKRKCSGGVPQPDFASKINHSYQQYQTKKIGQEEYKKSSNLKQSIQLRKKEWLTVHWYHAYSSPDGPGKSHEMLVCSTYKWRFTTKIECTFTGHLHSFKWHIFWTIDIYPTRINTYNYSLIMRTILYYNEQIIGYIAFLLEY